MPQAWVGRETLWQNRDAYGPGAAVIVPAVPVRGSLTIYNNTGVAIFPLAGGLATATNFKLQMVAGSFYEWTPPVPNDAISIYVGSAIAVGSINAVESVPTLVNV
jgi:hypothetical protein